MNIKPFAEQGNFTQVHNVVFDEMMAELTNSEFKLLMIIIRQHYGVNELSRTISIPYIAEKTGLTRSEIVTAMIGLLEKNIIDIQFKLYNGRENND